MGLSSLNIDRLSPLFNENDIVIIAPLNWGLGHASRCIPVIKWLTKCCKKIIIASDGDALQLLQKEFPDLACERLPAYGIQYKYNSIVANIAVSSIGILRAINQEKKKAEQLVKKYNATVILSDNRLMFRSSLSRNIYMTHQWKILHPNRFISYLATSIHRYFIRQFDICIIPDYDGKKALCPALSSGAMDNAVYIGPLTRIEKKEIDKDIDILVVLSGPEPQRTILESKLLTVLVKMRDQSIVFVRGVDTNQNDFGANHIQVIDIMTGETMANVLNRAKLLISRSGYSTVMDVHHLNLKAIWIPTPGQTEQEYLGEILSQRSGYSKINQNELNKLEKTIISLR
ncbi:MAG: hypothetical protein J5I52_05270 [Saprospiraceae bacterium]|nr:hypothetical protein [Saprospiraceae bacterium]